MQKLESNQVNEYRGYALFNDVEDSYLRNRNRGVVLANMTESGMNGTSLRHASTADIIGYFSSVPDEEKRATLESMTEILAERNIVVTGVVLN